MEQQGEEVTFENTVSINLLQGCILRDDILVHIHNKLLGINSKPRLGTQAQMRWLVSFRVPIRSTS